MPLPTSSHRKGEAQEKNKKGRLSNKAISFHGGGSLIAAEMLPRLRTVPELATTGRKAAEDAAALGRPLLKPAKLLLNVTIQRSIGVVHVLLPPEATADDLIAAALRQYVKEARRPVLASADASAFDLHYSQFTLESIDRQEKLIDLGSRNFFLCPRKASAAVPSGGAAAAPGCSKEVDIGAMKSLPGLQFMNFLL